MTPLNQRVTACPLRGDGADPNGLPGDCLRTAVASLLDLPYEQVPHFALHGRAWWDHLRRWARRHGVDFAALAPVAGTVRPFVTEPDGMLVLAAGPSPRSARARHVVLADVDGRTVWDPHPSRAGIPRVDEVYVATAPYWPPPQQRALTAAPARHRPAAAVR